MIYNRINKLYAIVTISMLLFASVSYAQVGINTQNPKVTLDVNASSLDGSRAEGIMAPRLTGDQIRLADSKFETDQMGTLLYATSPVSQSSTKTKNIVGAGYYFFDGTEWQSIKSASAWSLTGNVGINSTNFIGSLNSGGHVLFKVAGGFAGLLMDDATSQTYNVAFGRGALNLKSGNYLTTYYNTAFGANALSSNTGNNNTAIGTNAATSLVSGNYNTILGRGAFSASISGSQNVAVGYNSLAKSTTGSYNISIGAQSGNAITTGSNNIVIGYNQSATVATDSYQLNIGGTIYGLNLKGSNGYIGIGTATPSSKLEINSGIVNTSGLKFTNLNSSTPTQVGQFLGVDATGTVITMSSPTTRIMNGIKLETTESEIGSSGGDISETFNINATDWEDIPKSMINITIPDGGKAVFINFMLGLNYDKIYALAHYTVKLFIDGTETNVFQTAQGDITQSQFNLSTVKFLEEGDHEISIKMKKTLDSSLGNTLCGIMSMSYNTSYIN